MTIPFLPRLRPALLALSATAVLLAACGRREPVPAEARVQSALGGVMTVEVIDPDTRQAVLVDDEGSRIGVTVDPEVGPLDAVHPGDLVQMLIVDSTVVRLARPGEAAQAAMGVSVVGLRDNLPARSDVLATRRTVEVVSVSRLGDTVRYREADGALHTITVVDAQHRAFARGLRPGARVVVDSVVRVTISTIAND
ncbi:hypothetical protein [Oceanicella sp. SM1341]|uniref:hypothetical protein n=1 Tax=Oceanicella sp. SM1341 TaxID=1548889 RepID=UPI000E54ADE2|nr:hypothetical protein [Oceanicella sp. SM1341]